MAIQPAFGAYEVLERIGQGAMGTVFCARHRELGRPAAIKVLQSLAADPDAPTRFRVEAQAIARLRHPNILTLFDFGEQDGIPYMAVEHVPGGSLADRLVCGRPEPAATVTILRGVAAALDHAHSLGIVHRDVKPANVLIQADGSPVLADFGLAKLMEAPILRTATGVAAGTPAYMAPEQATGSGIGPATDRYALAVMAYEMLAGVPPFQGETMMELVFAHVQRQPDPPSRHAPELGEVVDAVLLRGLAKDPRDRWESCGAMSDALERALSGERVEVPRPRARRRRPPGRLLAAIAAVLALSVGGGLALRAATMSKGPMGIDRTLPASAAVTQGSTIWLHGHMESNTSAGVRLGSTPGAGDMARFRSDGNGEFEVTVALPSGIPTGPQRLYVCWRGQCPISTAIRVLSHQPTEQGPSPGSGPGPSSSGRIQTVPPLGAEVRFDPQNPQIRGPYSIHVNGLTPNGVAFIQFVQDGVPRDSGDGYQPVDQGGNLYMASHLPATVGSGAATVRVCNGRTGSDGTFQGYCLSKDINIQS